MGSAERRELRALIVEDREDDAELLLRELRRGGFDTTYERVETADAMRSALAKRTWDIVLSDFRLPELDALGALAVLAESAVDIPLIVVSGAVGEETAVEALRRGARDFVLKDRPARLVPAILRELDEAKTRRALGQAEEQLRQSQRLEAVGRLAAGVAHDINNVISVVLLNATLAEDSLEPGHAVRSDLEEIREAANRATALSKHLLAFSRQRFLEKQVVDLNSLIGGMEPLLRRLVSDRITLVTLLADAPACVEADPCQLEQVVMNLVVNARDAMRGAGKLRIETTGIDLDPQHASSFAELRAGPHVILTIADDGEGMDVATRARIFDPYFTTKEHGRGMGLGLATVFGIVKQSRGSIFVTSSPGNGTTFDIYFPRTTLKPAPSPSRVPPETAGRGDETILIVENDDAVRHGIRLVLERRGYTVIEARDDDAARVCAEHSARIDLLLVDGDLAGDFGALRPSTKRLLLDKPVAPEALVRKLRDVLA